MALLTHSVWESLNNLLPFMGLFCFMLFAFSVIGHFLYGSVLEEWSTPGFATVTAIDLIMGNYIFSQAQAETAGQTLSAFDARLRPSAARSLSRWGLARSLIWLAWCLCCSSTSSSS